MGVSIYFYTYRITSFLHLSYRFNYTMRRAEKSKSCDSITTTSWELSNSIFIFPLPKMKPLLNNKYQASS